MTLDKNALYEEVKRQVEADPSIKSMPPSARCFFYGVKTVLVLRQAGVRVILQAGSCQWPRIRPDQDDGVCATHFGYVWSPREEPSRRAMRLGVMMEMHVWAADPEANEIIDFTSGFFPEQAKSIGGFDWPGDPPPPFFWGGPNIMPPGAHYEANIDAIKYAFLLAAKLYGPQFVKENIL